jgi:hypothetical protein
MRMTGCEVVQWYGAKSSHRTDSLLFPSSCSRTFPAGALGSEYHCLKFEEEKNHESRFYHRRNLYFFDLPSWLLRGTKAPYDKHNRVG